MTQRYFRCITNPNSALVEPEFAMDLEQLLKHPEYVECDKDGKPLDKDLNIFPKVVIAPGKTLSEALAEDEANKPDEDDGSVKTPLWLQAQELKAQQEADAGRAEVTAEPQPTPVKKGKK